jgi:co-chaperonin GroES (HSP10)
MLVWYDFLASANCQEFVDEEGSEYKLIDYENLYVATIPYCKSYFGKYPLQLSTDKKEYVLPLNGFHIFERVYGEKINKFDIHSEKRVEKRLGIVKYVATNNWAYENGTEHDHVVLKQGDKVRFSTVPEVMLEDDAHCHFDGGRMYRRAQARNIDLVWRGDELILPKGKILISQIPDEEITPGGIILLKSQVKNHTGEVIISSSEQVEVGQEIYYIKGSGEKIEHEGKEVRVLNEGQILYVK